MEKHNSFFKPVVQFVDSVLNLFLKATHSTVSPNYYQPFSDAWKEFINAIDWNTNLKFFVTIFIAQIVMLAIVILLFIFTLLPRRNVKRIESNENNVQNGKNSIERNENKKSIVLNTSTASNLNNATIKPSNYNFSSPQDSFLHTIKVILFFMIILIVLMGTYLNQWMGNHHILLGLSENYFDSNGIFFSIFISAPLLVDGFILVVSFIVDMCQLMVVYKRKQIFLSSERTKTKVD